MHTEYEHALRAKFEVEIERVYAIVDRSVLRDRIWRAKYTFWATALVSVIAIGSMGAFASGDVLPFITPILNASVAWTISIATISISYYQRIKGGLDSVVKTYKQELQARDNANTRQMDRAPHVVINVERDSSTYMVQSLGVVAQDEIIIVPAATDVASGEAVVPAGDNAFSAHESSDFRLRIV